MTQFDINNYFLCKYLYTYWWFLPFQFADYTTGFGGKFGVQKDRVDKSAVGWEHHETIEKHQSQKGNLLFPLIISVY